jgi:hypothetical protein
VPVGFTLGSATKLLVLALVLPSRVRRIPVLAAEELSEER